MRVRVASAGTGKTTSLVRRYLELIASGTPLRRIAGVTFTRAAADELRGRVGAAISDLLDEGAWLGGLHVLDPAARPRFEEARLELDGAALSTIHGFMIGALRLAAPAMGLDPDFSVPGEWEAEALFDEEVASLLWLARAPEHGLRPDVERLGAGVAERLREMFGQRSLTLRFEPDDDPDSRALVRLFDAAYDRYRVRLGASRLPPGEVERRALALVGVPAALERVRERCRVVLVDEFQDVNPLQGRFFEALEAGGIALEAVGDPKQSIYGFRHADVGVFRRALARGERLEPLVATRRHAPVPARFLNRLTATLSSKGWGFAPEEAPEVHPAGGREEVHEQGAGGRVEVVWVRGDAPLDALRAREALELAARLRAHRDAGVPWSDMAVLARSYAGLALAEEGLARAGIPAVFLQGRGYFDRLEVRDLYHALRVGVDPAGSSLAAWLRGPFAGLDLPALQRVLAAEEPLAELEARHPEVRERLASIEAMARGAPLAALKFLVREPFLDGRRYIDHLEPRARENVDALLFTVARQPPGDVEVLLDRLDLLSRQRDAGDVPQSGDGVRLLTVHRSKGLEWRVVAVFDVSRGSFDPARPLLVHPDDGTLCARGAPRFEEARSAIAGRGEGEAWRLLYVAASRPRDALVLTGSVRGGRVTGWARALEAMRMGPDDGPFDRPELLLRTVEADAPAPLPAAAPVGRNGEADAHGRLEPAPWIDRRFPRASWPPVHSPSRAGGEGGGGPEEDHEPLPFSDPEEGERIPGRAAAVGTLVHYAISQDWSASDPRHVDNLRAQEVLFPYGPEEREAVLGDVLELLRAYEALLGRALPGRGERREDHAEIPMALPDGARVAGTVWQGVIDRLYRTGDGWFLEDYKTDRTVRPERYRFQLAVYRRAVREVLGVDPEVRLVFLRTGDVVRLEPAELDEALAEKGIAPLEPAARGRLEP